MIPTELELEVRRHPLAYLITVGGGGRAHVATVTPSVTGGRLCVPGVGHRSRGLLAVNPTLTLLWPPLEAAGHSLIVDGVGELRGDDLTVTPTRAVLHRPATEPPATEPPAIAQPVTARPAAATGCQADCVELLAVSPAGD